MVAALVMSLAAPASAVPNWTRPWLDTDVFASVPYPGHPETIVVDNGTVYVGTHQDATGAPGVPSKVFAYDRQGRLQREYAIRGQAAQGQGLLGMAMDGDGLLYVIDHNPSRVFTLNPRTGEQRDYAYFRDVAPCTPGQPANDCSATVGDQPAFADDLAFSPDGTLYVTDINQALIWRVPPGGGTPKVWFTDPRLESIFGPNGIRFTDNGRTLMFAQSLHGVSDPSGIPTGRGRLYKLPITAGGSPGDLVPFWESKPGDGIDGFAIGRSGKMYVAVANANALMVLSTTGQELGRTPATPEENAQREVPFNMPAGVAFLDDRVLVSNQAFFNGPLEHQVMFDVYVGEPGKPLFRP
ncbi:hypothetical protein Misp01_05390 [Microtetraspora sp. NBRC 13810]|nr:hypothetical protein Misp01_05390 [Microtetraspora sp. NBRC 13810]